MYYLPPLRRWLLPTLVTLVIIFFYKTYSQIETPVPRSLFQYSSKPPSEVVRIPISELKHKTLPHLNSSQNHASPAKEYYYSYKEQKDDPASNSISAWANPASNSHLDVLFQCPNKPNQFTNHIRLPNIIQNISNIPPLPTVKDTRAFWNPTIISLPYWSKNQYLLVSRIVTNGLHQENVVCEANICNAGLSKVTRDWEQPCTGEDLTYTGPSGGMRCASPPKILGVPPTPAEQCEGKYGAYVDIPGFHDPRIFWSEKGEPIMMVNTQSRYACFGLWAIDLRTLHTSLESLLSSSPTHPSLGPLMSYPTLTELTRNPPEDRSPIEKNWMHFFTVDGSSYLHYDLSARGGRTFAKLLGGGLTTVNLTDPLELPCLIDNDPDEKEEMKKKKGTWHQATNSLRLVLCYRADARCKPTSENTVFFAIIHHKYPNYLKLPLRYERFVMVWSATPPFSMLGISEHPIQMANETASGFSDAENWEDDEIALKEGRSNWAYFTYTTSIAYAWGRASDEPENKNWGYLDDEIILSIGIDDAGQGLARIDAKDLLQCLRACPGRGKKGGEEY